VGFELSAKKTKVMTINSAAHEPLTVIKGNDLAEISNFKYLGSYTEFTEADSKARKAVAWKALNSMSSVWKSHISHSVKRSFSRPL